MSAGAASPGRTRAPLMAALLSVCLWASAFVGIRAAGRAIAPGPLALGRLTIGTILLGVLLYWRGWIRLNAREAALLGVAGLLWFGLYNVALNSAERVLDAGTASMIINLAPLFVMILAAAFLRERLTVALVSGGLVAFAGVVLIALTGRAGAAPVRGVLLCLLATAASAAGLVAQKPVLGRLSALQVTWTCCLIGMLSCLGYAPALVRDLSGAPIGSVGWIVYLGVFPTSVAFTTWAYALARLEASRLATLVYLVPLVAIITSWMLLRETPPAAAIAGGLLCLGGVVVARRRPPVTAPIHSDASPRGSENAIVQGSRPGQP